MHLVFHWTSLPQTLILTTCITCRQHGSKGTLHEHQNTLSVSNNLARLRLQMLDFLFPKIFALSHTDAYKQAKSTLGKPVVTKKPSSQDRKPAPAPGAPPPWPSTPAAACSASGAEALPAPSRGGSLMPGHAHVASHYHAIIQAHLAAQQQPQRQKYQGDSSPCLLQVLVSLLQKKGSETNLL